MVLQVLAIEPGSDGDGRKWPKHNLTRNDAYFLERLGDMWIKDLPGGAQPGYSYRLDQLPSGYAGFEKPRADPKHIDRYIYGHPNGQFRSMAEFYPHFKHLMDAGGSAGCECVKCAGPVKKNKDPAWRKSKYFARPADGSTKVSADNLISPMRVAGTYKKGRYSSDTDEDMRRRDIDLEGTPDVYEAFIQRLKDAGPEGRIDEAIEERMSPDWRAINAKLTKTLKATRDFPAFAPRTGELVMFVRKINEGERIAWDKGLNTFGRLDVESNTWRDAPKWEAGVVTQMPQEQITDQDLVSDLHKEQSTIYSGFRVEPLPEPGNEAKPFTRQHKHIPLHATRSFALWQDCLRTTPGKEWHPTVKHAISVASSFCVVGRYRLAGAWPSASIFCRGLYLGPEVILLGDTVRLLPKSGEQRGAVVTEVMTITSIRLRFVNLDFDEEDLAPSPPALPHQTSLHITGKVFTTDPSRSFNGVTKKPLDPQSGNLPPEMQKYGPWYHYTDPSNPSARIEVPFSRLAGRCHEHSAMRTLFETPPDVKTEMQPPAFKAVNAPKPGADGSSDVNLLSRGLIATKESRAYSQQHDARLTSTEQLWFWADTRIEQLDLHEVNGRFVGAKDPMRTPEQLSRWHKALKGLDGKKGALEEYEAARKQRLEEDKATLQSTGGMMGSAAVDTEVDSPDSQDGAEVEDGDGDVENDAGDASESEGELADADAMDVDEPASAPMQALSQPFAEGAKAAPKPRKGSTMLDLSHPLLKWTELPIDLMDSEDEEEMAGDHLVNELFKNVRPGGSSAR